MLPPAGKKSRVLPYSWFLSVTLAFMLMTLIVSPATIRGNEDRSNWFQKQERDFEQFRQRRNQQFQEYLHKRWKEFQVFKEHREDPVPKPDTFPVAAPEPSPRKQNLGTVQQSIPPPDEIDTDSRSKLQTRSSDDMPTKGAGNAKLTVEFYGHEAGIPGAESLTDFSRPAVHKSAVEQFWKEFSEQETQPLVRRLKTLRVEWGLSDWDYMNLVRQVSSRIQNNDRTARLLSWALLLQSGYDVKIGFDGNQYFLLAPTNKKLYETSYLNLEGRRYYIIEPTDSGANRSIRSYDRSYPGPNKTVNLNLSDVPALKKDPVRRTIQFEFRDRSFQYDFEINGNRVKYRKSLPQVGLRSYFRAIGAEHLNTQLVDQLRASLETIPPQQRLEFLLHFSQRAFKYRTDHEQFGKENYLMPVETLYYPYSDCEDRALIFTALVKEFTDRDVLALDYPGHVASAVFTPEPVGTYFSFRNKVFSVYDPTYINADPGMVMPDYRDENPSILTSLNR